MRLNDGDEIEFGKGLGDDGNTPIELPDPRLCNLHLAVARVLTASGFAEVLGKVMKDWEDDQIADRVDIGDEVWRRSVLNMKGYEY